MARAQLDEDLDLLEKEISPPRVAQRAADGIGRRVSETASSLRPKAEAVAQKAKQTAGQATAPARRQLDAHPQVARTVRRTREGAGTAASAVRARVGRHPRAAGAVAGGTALATATVTMVVVLIRRRRHAQAHA